MATHEYLTVAETLARIKRRDFKRICAHIEVAAYTSPERYFPASTYAHLTRREAARFIRSAVSETLEKRGARVRVHLYGETLWLF